MKHSQQVRGLIALLVLQLLAFAAWGHEYIPKRVVIEGLGNTAALRVVDCCGCSAQVTAVSTNPCVIISPPQRTGVEVEFTVTATPLPVGAYGSYGVLIYVKGLGTGTSGQECTEDSVNFVPVSVVPPPSSGANALNAGKAVDPVNTFVGEFYHEEAADLVVEGPLPLVFSRHYSSYIFREGYGHGSLGHGWLHSFEWQLFREADLIRIVTPQGRILEFVPGTGGSWALQRNFGIPFQLVEAGEQLVLGDPRSRLRYRFGPENLLDSIADTQGNELSLAYAVFKDEGEIKPRLASVTDLYGRALSFAYDAGRHLASVEDQTGRKVQYTVSLHALESVEDACGKTWSYAYDHTRAHLGRLLVSMTHPEGNTPFEQEYDDLGRVVMQTMFDGAQWSFAYSDLMTTITDPLGFAVVHFHDELGNLIAVENEDGNVSELGYNESSRRTHVSDPDGSGYEFEEDPLSGNLASITRPDGAKVSMTYTPRAFEGIVFYYLDGVSYPDGTMDLYEYDARGNMVERIDRNDQQYLLTYTATGQVATVTLPLGGAYGSVYAADANLESITDPAGNETRFSYDAQNRLRTILHADDSVVSRTLDACDRVTEIVDENGMAWQYAYDDNGNLKMLDAPDASRVTYAYDAMNRLTDASLPNGSKATRSYDELGRLASLRDRSGGVNRVEFDRAGRAVTRIDEGGHTWRRTFDSSGLPTSFIGPTGHVTELTWTAQEQIERITMPRGGVYAFEFDQNDNLAETTAPAMGNVTYQHDPYGFLKVIRMGDGPVETRLARNAFGQVTAETDSRGDTWSTAYDAQGRRISETDPLGNLVSYDYDARNRVAGVTFPGGLGTLTNTYDAAGNLTRRLFSDGTDLVYSYDGQGSLIGAAELTLGLNGQGEIVESNGLVLERDAADRLMRVQYAPGKFIAYGYDERSMATSVTDWLGGVTTITRDGHGRIVGIVRPNGVSTTYQHDADGNVVMVQEIAPDGVLSDIRLDRNLRGMVVRAAREVPANQQELAFPALPAVGLGSRVVGYSYDAMGRRTADTERTYAWDLAGRLSSITEDGLTTSFTYDGLNKLTGLMQEAGSVEFVWNYGLHLPSIAVTREGADDAAYFVHLPTGQLLYGIDAASSSRRFFHFDESGNTLFTTNDGGELVNSYAYSPYGEITGGAAPEANAFAYQGMMGQYRLEGTNLVYMRARWYDTATARFLSRDPANRSVSPLESNPYSYARANPLFFGDPIGNNAKLIYDGSIHTDIEVDVWDGDQIIGTLKVGFFAKNYLRRKLGFTDCALAIGRGAESAIAGSFAYGARVGEFKTTKDTVVVEGTREQDERLVRQLLNWMGYPIGEGVSPGQMLKDLFPKPKGKTFSSHRVFVDSTTSYGPYRLFFAASVCNNFTDQALDVYFGHDWMTWLMPALNSGGEIFDELKRREIARHSKPQTGSWLNSGN